jgi:hypothetical protein
MGRALLILANHSIKSKAIAWIEKAPWNTRLEFKGPARSLDQNAKLWACLTDIAQQVEWYGAKLSAEDWKDVMTASLRRARVVPGIDPGTYVPLGMRTSDMSKEEFSNLIELVVAFGTERGVVWSEPAQEQAA